MPSPQSPTLSLRRSEALGAAVLVCTAYSPVIYLSKSPLPQFIIDAMQVTQQ